jgi:hypothetical protein
MLTMTMIAQAHTAIETVTGPVALTMEQLDAVCGGNNPTAASAVIVVIEVAKGVLKTVGTIIDMV